MDTLMTFFALYFTTLFSLDAWSAARNSAWRAPASGGNNMHYRPAVRAPEPGSYQAGMHGRGNAGPRHGDEERRSTGRINQGDSRDPLKMYGTAGCGACMG
ncbi:hypothetical protein BS50DRAFT_571347 [Corynespora cassiicola Philippines]|uniref:Secreted protein n=1 Tax=Corynespora cassiicola Philippines TaxID=1448308 RepID=A0A2T2NX96_CORCC|nr:hypothetical protein BS50DRAFT_571347 [Corynespora cassiicola Philippines]